MTSSINIARLLRELDTLATLTDENAAPDGRLPQPQRAVTRIVFTPCDLEARRWFRQLALAAGFTVREDAVGNTFVRWQGSQPELAPVGTGSHIDAIPHAGMYDGTVGVLGALEAMRSLQEAGFTPRRSLELVLFTSEEPTRFGLGCLGSRLLCGALAPELADALPDRLQESDPEAPAGGTLATVRAAAGFSGPLSAVPLAPGAYAAWLELHIEQGPLLERTGDELGVVTHIAGPASYRFVVEGVGGHAGGLLMPERRDALCGAAEVVLAVEQAVLSATIRSDTHETVGTVGQLAVYPGTVNAVPSRVTFSLDLRDTDTARRKAVFEAIATAAEVIAARRGLHIRHEQVNADDAVASDPALVDLLLQEAAAAGYRAQRMVSRAYHDTTFMARICPVAMLFLPCRGGVSHRPDEYAAPEAIEHGVRVLASVLAALTGEKSDLAARNPAVD